MQLPSKTKNRFAEVSPGVRMQKDDVGIDQEQPIGSADISKAALPAQTQEVSSSPVM